MSHERSDEIYKAYQDAVSRLDHFVTGAALALVGYLGTRPPTGPLGFNASTMELLALVAFAGAAYCGVKRLAKHSVLLGRMHQLLHEAETAAEPISVGASDKAALNMSTSVVHSPAAALSQGAKHQARARVLDGQVDDLVKAGAWWFQWRDRLLVAGLVLLVVGRALATLE